VTKKRYHDLWEDPTVDPEDVLYGDFEDDTLDGFTIYRFGEGDDEEEDDDA